MSWNMYHWRLLASSNCALTKLSIARVLCHCNSHIRGGHSWALPHSHQHVSLTRVVVTGDYKGSQSLCLIRHLHYFVIKHRHNKILFQLVKLISWERLSLSYKAQLYMVLYLWQPTNSKKTEKLYVCLVSLCLVMSSQHKKDWHKKLDGYNRSKSTEPTWGRWHTQALH